MNGKKSLSLPFFLAGMGTGAALALLFAPSSGAATRRLVGRKVKDGEAWVIDKAVAAKDDVLTQAARLRDRAVAAKEDVMAQAAGLRDRAKEAAEVMTRS